MFGPGQNPQSEPGSVQRHPSTVGAWAKGSLPSDPTLSPKRSHSEESPAVGWVGSRETGHRPGRNSWTKDLGNIQGLGQGDTQIRR